MESPKYKALLASLGGTSEGRGAKEFAAAIKAEYDLNGSVVKRLGIQPN